MEKFLKELHEMLELDTELPPDKPLSEIDEWDSLSVVTFLAMADLKYQTKINLDAIKEAATPADLYALLQHVRG